jgi:16S rRNA C967 or C1407 C5-methylase (RsmB/RsmF family)/NOL1/NOP2/fmu family ribosome biogenesis protein
MAHSSNATPGLPFRRPSAGPLPPALTESLRGIPGFDEQAFLSIHEKGPSVTSIRFNPHKYSASETIGERQRLVAQEMGWKPVPWCKDGWYLSSRPSFITDPAWHAGLYYVQEASSMFLEQVFLQHTDVQHTDVPQADVSQADVSKADVPHTDVPQADPLKAGVPEARPSGSLRVLDACAAPGGKSTHLQALIGKDGLLVSNEVIRTRVSILSENIQRWGGDNTVVTNNDPRDFGALPGFFDVLMVDAPCSGSGLFRREPELIVEWSPSQVQLCSQRQERILSDLWGSLRQGGLLIYSTCSYSTEEDEQILDWLCHSFEVESLPVALREDWGIVEVQAGSSGAYGYRFYPNRLDGEGFFIAALRKKGADEDNGGNHKEGRNFGAGSGPGPGGQSPAKSGRGKTAGPRRSGVESPVKRGDTSPVKRGGEPLEKGIAEALGPWIREPDRYHFLQTGDTIRAVPASRSEDLAYLSSALHVRHAGIALGQWMRTELIPDQGLALSLLLSPDIPRIALTREQALAYVRKDELRLEEAPKGWTLVTYGGHGLGWVKVLAGRINNYYPKQWRVLKR